MLSPMSALLQDVPIRTRIAAYVALALLLLLAPAALVRVILDPAPLF